ncbi:TraR/DksA C4-type zinc finger protein [Candidatus Microgenomates bacterium]|nr:TraR/DksA C4-type zinc finger protein [Candidatus Microgenomates bacterium]
MVINTLGEIKDYLLAQQAKLEGKLELFDKEESQLSERLPESYELGTYSWQSNVRETKEAVKEELMSLLKGIDKALIKVEAGTYGLCERCGRPIEEERLRILPTSLLCLGCKRITS